MRIKMLLFCAAVGLVMVGCGDKTEESKEVSKWEDGTISAQSRSIITDTRCYPTRLQRLDSARRTGT